MNEASEVRERNIPVDVWRRYYQATAERGPNSTLLAALERFDAEGGESAPRLAVDLGCGAGRDTSELLRRGWRVVAIDGEKDAIDALLDRPDIVSRERLTAQVARFEDATWPPADLINASLTLPFCEPAAFPAVWANIVSALQPGSRFAGHFFGDRDGWARLPTRSHHTRQHVELLLQAFEIELMEEREYDGRTAVGEDKHWHLFEVVARKR